MKKLFFSLACALSILIGGFLTSGQVSADGMVIMPNPYRRGWSYSDETRQTAYINYQDGLQKMILSINVGGIKNNDAVWIFPVASMPERVVVDIVDRQPELYGDEASYLAKNTLVDTTKIMAASQIYPIPFVTNILFPTMRLSSPVYNASDGSKSVEESGVKVYEHIDKYGITSEIITAKNGSSLYDYLTEKGLVIEDGALPVLDNYIGKDYSFVVSWMSNSETAVPANEVSGIRMDDNSVNEIYDDTSNAVKCYDCLYDYDYYSQPGVMVTFPTDKPYFPLMPTSVYGSRSVPATIYVLGFVEPNIFNNIKSYSDVTYHIESSPYQDESLDTFYGQVKYDENGLSSISKNLEYTKVEIDAPSKYLTEDLWFKQSAPIKAKTASFIYRHPFVLFISMMMMASVVSSLLAGLIIYRDKQPHKIIKLLLIGLSNFLSIIGVAVASSYLSSKLSNAKATPILAELKKRGYYIKRLVSKVLFIMVILISLASLLLAMLSSRMSYWGFSLSVPTLAIIVSLTLAFILRDIKPRDAELFVKLNEMGYSSWSFRPKDKRHLSFVAVFSIIFILITLLLNWLIGQAL